MLNSLASEVQRWVLKHTRARVRQWLLCLAVQRSLTLYAVILPIKVILSIRLSLSHPFSDNRKCFCPLDNTLLSHPQEMTVRFIISWYHDITQFVSSIPTDRTELKKIHFAYESQSIFLLCHKNNTKNTVKYSAEKPHQVFTYNSRSLPSDDSLLCTICVPVCINMFNICIYPHKQLCIHSIISTMLLFPRRS